MLTLLEDAQLLRKDIPNESDDDEPTPKQCISQEAMLKLNEMRVTNQLCDASIRTGDEIFNVHRAILCACSEYFRISSSTLFTTTLNKDRGNVSSTFVVGVTPAAMEEIIQYAYLRDVSGINDSNVAEMLFVSDYFGVLGLMKYCIDYIIRTLSPENCIIVWLMSRYRCIHRLMEKSRNYVLKNFVQVAVDSTQILDLNIDDFHGIVNDEMLNVKDEQVVWECVLRWIDSDAENRTMYLTKLMRSVRMGLLPTSYFMAKVKANHYVKDDPETLPIILETMKFLCDLEAISTKSDEMQTPALAVPRLPHEVIFAIGGWSEGAPQNVIETYDTRADRWIRIKDSDPSGPRSYHGTAVIKTKIYCCGGFNGRDYFNICSRFDAEKRTWCEIAPMHSRRCYVSVAALGGMIYALGGFDGTTRLNTSERYNPSTNQWTMIAPMHYQRSDADACIMNGKIYVTGGETIYIFGNCLNVYNLFCRVLGFTGQECLNTAEYYTPSTDSWTLIPPMTSRRSGVSCVAHRGLVYVVGGFNGISRMNTCERFDPHRGVWTNIKNMCHPRSNFGLEIIDDMILAIGGFSGVVTIAHCECYVPETNEWLEATDMGIIRSALTANVVSGLPNIRDYIHKDRHKLIEEKRLKTLFPDSSTSQDVSTAASLVVNWEIFDSDDDDEI